MPAITVYKGKDPEIVDFEITSEQGRVRIATKNEALTVTIYNTNFRNEYFEGQNYPLERGIYSVIIEKVGPNIDLLNPPRAILNF